MANNNDYNYYKSEYSKFKNNYYTPGNNNNNNKGSGGKSFKRFLRAFLVFLITFGIIAAAIFGGIKLYKNISSKKETKTTAPTTVTTEKTTEDSDKTTEATTKPETTTQPETTTSNNSSGKITAGTVAVVKTPENTGIYLRHNPTYDEYGYAPLKDGTTVVVSEVTSDGLWAKTSNFDINGWVYTKYLVSTSSTSASTSSEPTSSSSSPSSSADSSDNLTFDQALTVFGNDTSRNLYMNCKINSSNVKGIADYQDANSKVISTFSSGQKVPIYSVRSGYGKTRVNGIETWIPTQYLDFESWGHYR